MPPASKPEIAAANTEEERLAQALIGRGLITREELQQCPSAEAPVSGQALLSRLVKSGFLTANQARRAVQELQMLVGQQIPGYHLLEKLGQGGMGLVYKAKQLSMNRLVAIKLLHQRLVANPQYLENFTREAHVAAKLSHNNIVQAIDVGSAGDLHYFVMEYVEGTTLRKLLDGGKIYNEREALEIVIQIAQALDHAHRRQLVHRDIKPGNIILTPEGVAKLADLGLARQTGDTARAKAEKGLALGTPYYISPEQVQGREDIDIRADIYALGATAYHMATGKTPFASPNIDEVLDAHLRTELTPPDHLNTTLSSGFGEVVEFMMAKSRQKRYQTPRDLMIDLECLLSGEAPKLARQRLAASTLEELAVGEAADDDISRPRRKRGKRVEPANQWLWLGILGGLLGLSVLLNLIQLLRH